MARIRIKSGTRAQLTAASALLSGEPFFVTDEENVIVGGGPDTGAAAGVEIVLTPYTRATLDAAKTAGTLSLRELYHITDEARIAVATGPSSYIALVKESEGAFVGVAAPTNLLPKPNALGLTKVKLVGSIYYSTEGKAHQASKFQISTSATFGTLAYEGTKGAVTTASIKAADIASNASYYWRVSYQDASGSWSAWSVPTAFSTGALVDTEGTGGTITYDGDYTVHTFTSNGTFYTPVGITTDTLAVAGGGGGGSYGGGGGGGGVRYTPDRALPSGAYAITVGAGGVASANGGNSQFHGDPVAIGGGRGGGESGASQTGGSGGGGGGNPTAGAAGAAGQGYAGGTGANYATAGGGGAGGAGKAPVGSTAAGAGGVGFACAISPSATHYGGGGGGGRRPGYGDAPGLGGVGGGGNGGMAAGNPGASGTGGGGGGGAYDGAHRPGGAGGKGVVIVRYLS